MLSRLVYNTILGNNTHHSKDADAHYYNTSFLCNCSSYYAYLITTLILVTFYCLHVSANYEMILLLQILSSIIGTDNFDQGINTRTENPTEYSKLFFLTRTIFSINFGPGD